MTPAELATTYRGYIDCLNRQDWANLGQFVGDAAHYNGKLIGLSGYLEMLKGDFRAIPDLCFNINLLVAGPPHVAARLLFDCTPTGMLFDLPVNGARVTFSENVFYEFQQGRIANVWSLIDKATIALQLAAKN